MNPIAEVIGTAIRVTVKAAPLIYKTIQYLKSEQGKTMMKKASNALRENISPKTVRAFIRGETFKNSKTKEEIQEQITELIYMEIRRYVRQQLAK